MPTLPSTPPDITALSTPPNRIGSTDTAFVAAVDTFFGELPAFGTEQNTLADWEETTATQVYNNAIEASTSATNAATSEGNALAYSQNSASSANYNGEWSAQTGAANKPYSVSNNGALWGLVNNLADVALSEPAPGNADWFYISGTRWLSYTLTASLNANSQNYVHATTSTTELTQPAFSVNDFIVIKNSIDSNQVVRLLNPNNTIIGEISNVPAGTDLLIPAGSTVHLVARATNILEVV